MTKISMIVAIDENNAIGKDNQMLCHLPNDLKYFKATTLGHTVIMGRKTYESLPNGALPNRRNIVLSRKEGLKLDKCEVFSALAEVKKAIEGEDKVFIMGGATLYNDCLDSSDELYITYIYHAFEEADTFFPKIDTNVWKEISRTENKADEKNQYDHSFVVYQKQ